MLAKVINIARRKVNNMPRIDKQPIYKQLSPSTRGGRPGMGKARAKAGMTNTARTKINPSSSKVRDAGRSPGKTGLVNTNDYGTVSAQGSSVGRPSAPRGATRTYTIKEDGVVGPQTGSALLGSRWGKMGGGKTSFTVMGARKGTKYTGSGKSIGAPQGYVNKGGKAFTTGMTGPQVVAIKKALSSKGYYKGDLTNDKYDASVRSAVARFQKDWNKRMSKPGHQTVRAARGQVVRLGD
jgi:hypothetical protein